MELFTVIVPVLNRVHTIAHTLLSCLVQNDERFQILVSDNHSSDGTYEELVRWAARDARITLIRPPCRMGQATHWEFALEHVREGYFMFLGGDDALLPRCMERARACLAAHPGVKALHSPICVTYLYPDVHGERAGCLTTWPKVGMELRDSGEWLRRVIGGECGILELPYPYAFAWCHMDVLDDVRKKGRLIPCRTPPVFLALAAARYSSQFLMVSPGFAAPGVSRESIGYSCQFPGGPGAGSQILS
ncbi:glycosyltransferase family 2 protein [Verrucomicrobium spinosum]|uniref:glycosyltransferase family 2 protein n=1 Tax=Verrucomicrobium spinosum TaxID=2736 RepID=UPI00094611D8|nr:glycosyltransferase family A protein [Verrucomicrobium spinosum]